MTTATGPLLSPRRSRRPDLVTLVLAAVLVAGVSAGVVGGWSFFGSGGGATSAGSVGPPPTLSSDPGGLLGPAGSSPPEPTASGRPSETYPTTPGPTIAIPTAPPTAIPTTVPSPTPAAEPGFPTIEDAIAAALARMALPERFAGDCDAAPLETICGGQLARLGDLYAWGVGYTGTDWVLGTVVARRDAAGWHPVLFDPGTIVSAGTAIVGGTGGCLPLRAEARRDAAQLACLPDGARVQVTGVMAVADGYLWVAAEGGGWLPGRWLCGPGCEGVPDTVWTFEPAP